MAEHARSLAPPHRLGLGLDSAASHLVSDVSRAGVDRLALHVRVCLPCSVPPSYEYTARRKTRAHCERVRVRGRRGS